MKKHMIVHGDGKKKKKKVVHVGDSTPFLPEEIITNILKRLPVKCLIRFQCVCKHWKNLMKSSSFIAEHLHHSSNQNPRLLCKRTGANTLNLYVVDCDDEIQEAIDIQKPPSISDLCLVEIIDSCNGLICALSSASYVSYLGSRLFLWNPATREVRWVPGVIHGNYDRFYFGFGFSPIVNDYKIVKISTHRYVIKRVEVYSLKTDTWKDIEFGNIKRVQVLFSNAASVNGSIFWHGLKVLDVQKDVIVSFDVAKEVFTLMKIPPLDIDSLVLEFTVHNKKLVLICITTEYDYWVMEEGVDASGKKWSNWTKMDNRSPYNLPLLSSIESKIATIRVGGAVDDILFYVESLVPVAGQLSQ